MIETMKNIRQRQPLFGKKILLGVLMAAMTSTLLFITPSSAQRVNRQYSSYVTPFPAKGVYRVLVLGDSLGEGVWSGLGNLFQGDRSLQLINKALLGSWHFPAQIYWPCARI